MSAPKVSIVITHYKENTKKYLDLCVQSVMNLDYPNDKLNVLITSPKWNRPEYPGVLNVSPSQDCCFAANLNYGISVADKNSEFFLVLSDDVIVTKDSLKNMVTAAMSTQGNFIIGATSNCDNQWQYLLNLGFEDNGVRSVFIDRFYPYEAWAPIADKMMNAKSVYPSGIIIAQQLCLYANLIPRKIWETVGQLDENFNEGFEDTDYCHRTKLAGFGLCISLDSIIWHFGGATTNQVCTEESGMKNLKYYQEKWNGKQG